MTFPASITATPLTAEAMAPFVTVLAAGAEKQTLIEPVFEQSDIPGAFAFTIIRAMPVPGNVTEIRFLERHPYSTQSFVPIKAGRWLILVAPDAPDGSPDIAHTKAFLASPDQSICIHRNVWHAPLTVFDKPAEFGMIMWKSTNGADGVIHKLGAPLVVTY